MDRRRITHRSHGRSGPTRGLAGRLAAAGVVLAGLVVLIADGHDVSWLAGLLAGAGAGVVLTGRRTARPAATVVAEKPAATHQTERTDAAVAPLQAAGWRFLRDLPGSDGTYERVAVGPGGVILLQSLTPEGVVTVQGGQFILERPSHAGGAPIRERLRPRALADAVTFREDVQRVAGQRTWVQAVVVLWCEFPAGLVVDGRCVYIHGSRLAGWMSRRPHQLDPAEADEVFAAVELLAHASGELALPIAV